MGEIRHLVSANDISRELLGSFHDAAEVLTSPQAKRTNRANISNQEPDGISVIYNFVEPSTRTRVSFITASQLLGVNVEGTENAKISSSSAKKETLENGIITLSQYAKKFGKAAIVMRDSEEGAAARAAAVSEVPIVNAGDGGHEHPTQGILDTFTMRQRRGELDNRTLLISGDALNSRTAHSLISLMLNYDNNRFVIAAPPELPLPDEFRTMIKAARAEFEEVPTLSAGLETTAGAERDIYFIRDQEERRKREINALRMYQVVGRISLTQRDRRIREKYITDFGLSEEILRTQINENDAIYHALPEGGEVSAIGRYDLRNQIWDQVSDGVETRMAVLMYVMRIGLFRNGDYKKLVYAPPAS